MNSLGLFPFMFRGIMTNRSYNDLIKTGYYKIQENMIDGPSTYWGTLVVFNDSDQITQVFYPNIDSAEISTRKGNINHILHIYSSPNGTLDSCNYIRVILSDKYIFVNKLFEKGYNSIRLFKDRKSFYVYVYSSVWTRTKIEVFSENPDLFYFTNVTDEISISDLEEISIS